MSVAAPAIEHQQTAEPLSPTSRLRDESLTDSDRNFAIAMHLSPFVFIIGAGVGIGLPALLAPLILWLVRKDQSVFNDDHGREMINFGLSFVLFNIVLAITIIGMVLIPVLWVVAVVNFVRGAIAANRGEYFRYPVTIRFLS